MASGSRGRGVRLTSATAAVVCSLAAAALVLPLAAPAQVPVRPRRASAPNPTSPDATVPSTRAGSERASSDAAPPAAQTGSAAKPSTAQSDGGETLDLESNLVLVSTVVTKFGEEKAMRDLRKSDFHVEDEGVPQEIAFFGDETLPLNVEFLFDASDSLKFRDRFQREALASFLNGLLRPNDRAAILSFNDRVRVEQEFTSDSAKLLAAIDRLPAGGATALYDAVVAASDRMARETGRRAIVILSDGRDTFSEARLDAALKRAQGADAVVYAINTSYPGWSVTDDYRRNDPLEFLASETGGEVFYPGDAKEVVKTLALLSSRLRQRYVLGFYPTSTRADGRFHRLVVRVDRKNARVLARTGYYAPTSR